MSWPGLTGPSGVWEQRGSSRPPDPPLKAEGDERRGTTVRSWTDMVSRSSYALRLLPSLKAVAEKLTALRTATYFAKRARRADLEAFDRFMGRRGGAPPRPDDVIE